MKPLPPSPINPFKPTSREAKRDDTTTTELEDQPTLLAEVERLVKLARKEGEEDNYPGKRKATRISNGLSLELTDNPTHPSAINYVTMNDVSLSGLSFWSRQKASYASQIYIRFYVDDTPSQWIPALVKHCSVGLRGHVIGAEFVLDS